MVMKPGNRKTGKNNPPILSHEFIIQNHADIISCVAMVFVIGLMVQATTPIASLFIALHHNVSDNLNSETNNLDGNQNQIIRYEQGWKDSCAVFFYSLICIVMHAILQEYVLDKISKRLHLSKTKLTKFNESGQLSVFYLVSLVWGTDAILREGFLGNISRLWEGYPLHSMGFLMKLFLLVQLSYWLHTLPELYFQRIKREEWPTRVQRAICGFAFVGAGYFFSFQRIVLCLLVLHYVSEFVCHAIRLVEILDRDEKIASACSLLDSLTFAIVRVLTIILSVLTFWYGLAQNSDGNMEIVNKSTYPLRLGALISILSLQIYLSFNYITELLRKVRERREIQLDTSSRVRTSGKNRKGKRNEESDLPEVDQNTNKNLRSRSQNKNK